MKLSRIFYAAVPFFGLVLAKDNEPIPNSFVEKDILLASGQNLAFLSRPLWHFARSRGNPTCYPSSALFENGTQVPPAPLEFFPKAAFGCPDPGPRGEGPPFPTYYTVNYCGADEIRIQYSLFFKKDGFIKVVLSPCNGHAYDWERIIVVWKRNTTDNTWTRNKLLRSFHSGYKEQDWNDVQSTFNYDDINEIHGKNKDGPKIYVGWGKHAMFDDRNTGWNDCFSQGCNREFRSDDWWYLPRLGKQLAYSHYLQ